MSYPDGAPSPQWELTDLAGNAVSPELHRVALPAVGGRAAYRFLPYLKAGVYLFRVYHVAPVSNNPQMKPMSIGMRARVAPPSFKISVSPNVISIPANNAYSVKVDTTLLNPAEQDFKIALTVATPPGVVAGALPHVCPTCGFNPTSIETGSSDYLMVSVPLGTPPTANETITITGDNGAESHSVTVDWSTLACTPETQSQACGGMTCGAVSDGCGGNVTCGAQCCTAQDVCGTPRAERKIVFDM